MAGDLEVPATPPFWGEWMSELIRFFSKNLRFLSQWREEGLSGEGGGEWHQPLRILLFLPRPDTFQEEQKFRASGVLCRKYEYYRQPRILGPRAKSDGADADGLGRGRKRTASG